MVLTRRIIGSQRRMWSGAKPPGMTSEIEVVGADVAGRLVALDRIAELAGIGLPGLGADQRHLAAGLAQAIDRIPDLHLLILLLDQDRGALALQFHRNLLCEMKAEAVTALAGGF